MAKTLEEMIAELKGLAPIKGGVMSLLDTPANNERETQRTQYLMDMFAGTNPETGDSFLEPTPTTASTIRGFDTPAMRDDAIINSITTNNLGVSARDLGASARDLGFSNARGFTTPAMRDNAQAVLSRLSDAELKDVMEILPQLNDVQYEAFIAGLENGSINPSGYEVTSQYRLGM
jgi:hypothetical protein